MQPEIIITLVVAIFGSTGFWSVINLIIQKREQKKSAETKAIVALLHDRIYSLCADMLEKGYITTKEHSNLEFLYKPYIALGGNGTARIMKEQVDNLEIKE